MNKLENRLQKLEEISPVNKIRWVRVIQFDGQTEEEAIRLAGYPAYEENRGVIFRKIVKSFSEQNAEFLIDECSGVDEQAGN